MRITGGSMRGRVVRLPEDGDVRPTASRTREALFSMLGQNLAGQSVLDAFGGSGLLAFEAASRGAGPVLITDRHAATVRQIRASAQALGLVPPAVEVRHVGAERICREGVWDLVLLDPPYADAPERWVLLAAPAARRVLVIEHRRGGVLPEQAGALHLHRVRTYGDSALGIYRAGPLAGGEEMPVVGDDSGVVEDNG